MDVTLDIAEAKVVRRSTSAELLRGAPALPPGHRHVGLNDPGERIRVRPLLDTGTDAYKTFCYIVEAVEITIQARPAIHVGNEFPRGYCASEVIEYHQRQLLDLWIGNLRALGDELRRALPRVKTLQLTGTARDGRHARTQVEGIVADEIAAIRAGLDADLERRSLALMANDAVRRELAICPVEDWAEATWPDPGR